MIYIWVGDSRSRTRRGSRSRTRSEGSIAAVSTLPTPSGHQVTDLGLAWSLAGYSLLPHLILSGPISSEIPQSSRSILEDTKLLEGVTRSLKRGQQPQIVLGRLSLELLSGERFLPVIEAGEFTLLEAERIIPLMLGEPKLVVLQQQLLVLEFERPFHLGDLSISQLPLEGLLSIEDAGKLRLLRQPLGRWHPVVHAGDAGFLIGVLPGGLGFGEGELVNLKLTHLLELREFQQPEPLLRELKLRGPVCDLCGQLCSLKID
jgi:hypothetical protein